MQYTTRLGVAVLGAILYVLLREGCYLPLHFIAPCAPVVVRAEHFALLHHAAAPVVVRAALFALLGGPPGSLPVLIGNPRSFSIKRKRRAPGELLTLRLREENCNVSHEKF